MGRTAQGVKSMRVPEGEHIVDMCVVQEDSELLTISANGFGKRSPIADYPLQGRNGKGVKAGNFSADTGSLVALKVIPADTDVMMIADNGIIIRVDANEISRIGRATKGVKVMRLKDETKIVSIALTPHVEYVEEETTEEGETEGEATEAQDAQQTDDTNE